MIQTAPSEPRFEEEESTNARLQSVGVRHHTREVSEGEKGVWFQSGNIIAVLDPKTPELQ